MSKIMKVLPWLASVFISGIFLDSLRFKFTGHQTPEHIFTTLRDWSGIGLFFPAGPWIIGVAELTAFILLIVLPIIFLLKKNETRAHQIQALGALLSLGVMGGAIVFHLFTPLGIETPVEWAGSEPTKFSAALFYSACVTWLCAAFVFVLRWRQLKS